jgi:protein tyrosine phosphatase (PTP) superfamily phosphohydrolase (DUF442 family)
MLRRRGIVGGLACVALAGLVGGWMVRQGAQVHALVPGRIYRGPWQNPSELHSLIDRYAIKTIVTLTAINSDDPKFVAQKRVVDETGVSWRIISMRGSTATLDQLDEAVDLICDPANQPVFFHCVGGHHRSNLVHAAYRIRIDGHSAADAWAELCSLPWTRPGASRDAEDQRVIQAYGQRHGR